MDLYYDPIVDEHVGRGPIGIIAPAWYFAPQRREVAYAGWMTSANISGALTDGPIIGLDEPERATMLLQVAGEFADPVLKARIWQAADEFVEPSWDRERGEFTLGFGLDEAHPRGQLNARSMAGWVCTEGAWARIFNEPNLTKFDKPTVEGVDFPRVALSEARWDGSALHLAAHPQTPDVEGTSTTVRLTNVDVDREWLLTDAKGSTVSLTGADGQLSVELVVDNQVATVRPLD